MPALHLPSHQSLLNRTSKVIEKKSGEMSKSQDVVDEMYENVKNELFAIELEI